MLQPRKGRPRMRWLDYVESDLKKMKVKGWKEKMRNREQWRHCRGDQGSPRAVAPSGRKEFHFHLPINDAL
jgi:hypothetical protein